MKNILFRFLKYSLLLLVCSSLLPGLTACNKKNPAKPVKAKLALSSMPSGAKITIAGKQLEKPTPLKVSLPEGVYIVKFQLPGYAPEWKKVTVHTAKEEKLDVSLTPLTTNLLVAAQADKEFGVQVTYRNKLLRETPLVIRNIPMGKGELTLSKKGYSSQLVTFEAKDATPIPPITENLNSNMGTLSLDTIPSGAQVLLNGEVFGNTPFRERLEEGTYNFIFRKADYEEVRKLVHVKRHSKISLPPIRLVQKKSSLKIASTPSGARLFLDGIPYGSTPQTLHELTPGLHTVRVEKEGFDADEHKINLTPGSMKQLHLTLDTNLGGLDLVTSPAGLTVYVDGKAYGKTRPDPENPKFSEVMQIRNLTMGKHTIRIFHKRAKRPRGGNLVKEVYVKKGKIVRLENISLWIPDTRLYMKNGSVIEGCLHYQNDKVVYFESYPGAKAERLKNYISKIEPIPLEE